MTTSEVRRRNGIYYTPPLAAQVMVKWAIRSHDDRVLEPCFGSGVFLAALRQANAGQIRGVEVMVDAYSAAVAGGLVDVDHSTLGDFLGVTPFQVDVAIGNPPYVRLRSLPAEQEERARRATEKVLGAPMESAGSVWMAFVLHATQFLVRGGRLAFVLPYEITHVRYAKSLWEFLGKNFGNLRLVRVKERMFPDLMQEAIILFADNRGGSTDTVYFEAYERTRDLDMGQPTVRKDVSVKAVIEERPFVRALLPDGVDALLERVLPLTSPVPEFCTFNIGYVSGHKRFFHPDAGTVTRFRLPETSLRSTVVASRGLSGAGLRTSGIALDDLRRLFYPNGNLSQPERRYILQGEREGIDTGYKCRSRKPWYRVPDVRVPDVMLSVFREVPALVANDAALVASNSILCGFLRASHAAEQLMAAWYTSLTLLYCELRVHSLGGGVLVVIPGEVANVRIPQPSCLPVSHMAEVDRALLAKKESLPDRRRPCPYGVHGTLHTRSYIHSGRDTRTGFVANSLQKASQASKGNASIRTRQGRCGAA